MGTYEATNAVAQGSQTLSNVINSIISKVTNFIIGLSLIEWGLIIIFIICIAIIVWLTKQQNYYKNKQQRSIHAQFKNKYRKF